MPEKQPQPARDDSMTYIVVSSLVVLAGSSVAYVALYGLELWLRYGR